MAIEITVPTIGESITEATVLKWLKSVGEAVVQDEPLLELETDKVSVEVNAPATGMLENILVDAGEDVAIGAVLGLIAEGAAADATVIDSVSSAAESKAVPLTAEEEVLMPAVRRLVEEHKLDPTAIPAADKDGRLTKGDVLAYLESVKAEPTPVRAAAAYAPAPSPVVEAVTAAPQEERVRMTRLRQRMAERLKEAQNTAAMLTTFNEVDMTASMEMRSRYKEVFEKKYGVRIGFMSLFAKACVIALQEFPAINAQIDGNEIVYKNHYDIGVAVGSGQGLVVPVVRGVEHLGFAEIESKIRELADKAKTGQLTLDELQGGTFTITNGGIYGSMMSTPILNSPQSGILGMHNITQRAMVMPDGGIQARPMMYLALSYDHRIVDGREAVGFLVRIKECIEDPQRMLLEA
ncbi:2-oxoglutarate dehydrogenase complex dihydrolipoyllysine-residue succinyltransferase [Pseudomonadota bacterium]